MSKVLATDLDGTLIPLENVPENQTDLQLLAQQLREHDILLTFVTGRHLASVLEVSQQWLLPIPEWIICDVGTSIYRREEDRTFQLAEPYADHLQEIVADFEVAKLRETFRDWDTLRLQEEEKQGRFKLSFYCDADQLERCHAELRHHLDQHQIPYSIIASIDPFDGVGLIDLLPRGVSKAYGLKWWTDHLGLSGDGTVFAGDSGNDLAAMTAGYRTIVVSNCAKEVTARVQEHFQRHDQVDRLYLASRPATSGVLDGCWHFGLFSPAADPGSPNAAHA